MQVININDGGASAQFEIHRFGNGRPHLFFTAGIHGDEVSGIYVAEKLITHFSEKPPQKGSISIIPTVNRSAMRCLTRRNPFDEKDLNRVFPGDEEGSFAERLADAVYKATEDADMIVDLHCCGQHGTPYILSIYDESKKVQDFVSKIGMPIALQSEGTEKQLFTESTRRRNQATCIIELPSGRSPGVVNLEVAELCYEGLLDLLKREGFEDGPCSLIRPKFYGKLLNIDCPKGGLWMPSACKGTTLREGELIGKLDGSPVSMPEDGFLMSVRPCSYVMSDDLWAAVYIVEKKEV